MTSCWTARWWRFFTRFCWIFKENNHVLSYESLLRSSMSLLSISLNAPRQSRSFYSRDSITARLHRWKRKSRFLFLSRKSASKEMKNYAIKYKYSLDSQSKANCTWLFLLLSLSRALLGNEANDRSISELVLIFFRRTVLLKIFYC